MYLAYGVVISLQQTHSTSFPLLEKYTYTVCKTIVILIKRARIQFKVIRQWKSFTIEGSLKPIPHLFCTCCLSFVVHSLCLF